MNVIMLGKIIINADSRGTYPILFSEEVLCTEDEDFNEVVYIKEELSIAGIPIVDSYKKLEV